ncbi:MAG: hypothetical protein ACD_50C00308G0002 [uncultured bacterium]|nr:MAG: hypothetical protein ACD_50C00308G0002 [uncultured bacterium]
MSFASSESAPVVPLTARISSQCPSKKTEISVAISQYSDSPGKRKVAATENVYPTVIANATRVIIPGFLCEISPLAALKKGIPPIKNIKVPIAKSTSSRPKKSRLK